MRIAQTRAEVCFLHCSNAPPSGARAAPSAREQGMFEFETHDVETSETGSGCALVARDRRSCCSTAIRRRTSCGTGWRPSCRAVHASSARICAATAIAASRRPTPEHAAYSQAGNGAGHGRGDAALGSSASASPGTTAAAGSPPDGARPSGSGRAGSPCSTSCRRATIFRRPTRHRDRLLPLVLPDQPEPLPERLIGADPNFYLHGGRRGSGLDASRPRRWPSTALLPRPGDDPRRLRGLPRRRDDRPRS